MGDVVRPDFRQSPSMALNSALPVATEALSFCGIAGLYRVALFQKEDPSAGLKVVVMRYDSDTMYPVATLSATEEGRIEGHMIAKAVLESLRLAHFFCDDLIS